MLAFGLDRNLYVGNRENSDIRRYDGRTGAFLGVFVKAGSGGLVEPGDFTFGPDGNLYVINGGTILSPPPDEVLRFNGRTGAPMGAFVKAGSGLTEPHNLTFGPDGSLYVGGLAFGPDGDLYVSDWQKSDVVHYDGRTGDYKGVFVPPSGLGISGVMGLASRYILFGPRGSGGAPLVAAARVNPPAAQAPSLVQAPGAAQSSELPLPAGTIAPDITVQDKAGKPLRLADYRGKTVVLDFWATWCGPCLMSLPHTNEVAKRFADKNVVVLAVNVRDTKSRFDGWLPKNPNYDAITFAIEPTQEGDKASRLYHVSGIPVQYVIDPAGKIVKSFLGYGLPTTDLADALTEAVGNAPHAGSAQARIP
jgi:thiol-disulfide isomerase/thioredoxin